MKDNRVCQNCGHATAVLWSGGHHANVCTACWDDWLQSATTSSWDDWLQSE